MLDDPAMRNEVTRALEKARTMRSDFKRDGKAPQWPIVKSEVATPLAEVRNRIGEELARRQSNEALVPIDRDPVLVERLNKEFIPVLVDVDPIYYGLDPAKMEKAITPKTRCVIPVHLFGQASDMDPILEIARKHNLKVIEDSCETMFASYNGRRVGSLGDIGCFSTYVAHLVVTGVGGINTTNNPDYMIKIRSLLNHGRDSIYISIDDDKDKSGEELHTIIDRTTTDMEIKVQPVLTREGGSIPVVSTFQEELGLPSVLFGVGLPDENAHAPNEKLDVGNFHGGIIASAILYEEIADAQRTQR